MSDQVHDAAPGGDCCKSLAEVRDALEKRLREHESQEAERLKKALAAFERDAFADGKLQHKLAHQAMIDAARAEREFWQSLKIEIAKKSIWGILQVLTILLVAGILAKFGLGALVAGVTK